ncbi:glycoside hydrolase family 35 protein [Silvibacterium dinghuense]|uniref:Beta-galactosidase n=1 Tax=Silvibacterium dinghuense TaxID=1560006 RepID=A0A4Q1SB35_9BACT|nr:beta-galactosidase [Silvibacterium dinghuense]RXS94275.1 beta-galactosidase [Silvibacterium dinghuense]GGH17249.1 beta-galactosidase [Silvibacterium dinghuense]
MTDSARRPRGRWSCSALLTLSITTLPIHALFAQSTPHTFGVQQGHFALDGKPFRIISGEIHYARIPRAEWRARLKMAKAMGLNTITTYVFWNLHEPQPGSYDFSGQNDVAEFIREAQQEGLYVILRPGPYVCAEWEWGGYPSWLLRQKGIVVRSSDPKFITPVTSWMKRLGQELAPLQIGNSGPIIAVQVENEYGSFGDDHAYMEQIKSILQASGFTRAMLYTADGPEQLPHGALPELPAVINFGTGGAKEGFALLHTLRPDGPFMSGEYWAGWFDHWGEKHHVTDGDKEAAELAWMLNQGYSVSMYMFDGGTSFGWMNGANSTRGEYQPDTTSYDYDAPVSESGIPTDKFYKFRDVIAKATGITPLPVPAAPTLQTIPSFSLSSAASLWDNLPAPIHSAGLQSMEDLGQAYGYILYRTQAPADADGDLIIDGLHDYAQIYADGKLLGTLDRRLNQTRLHVTVKKGQRLDFLVENSGRVNFTPVLRGERKGILGSVTLASAPLQDWSIYPLPMLNPGEMTFRSNACDQSPCFYRGSFQTESTADTYLDTSNFTKGFVWINGHPLGRIWSIGPQHTLFTPGSWLKQGENEVIVLDLHGVSHPTMQGRDKPIFATAAPAK